MLLAFNKPYGVLSQFSDRRQPPRPTLASFGLPAGVYPAGRLDLDSEGLLLLSDDGPLIARISSPRFHWPKTYLVQVEGEPTDEHLERLRTGVTLKDGPTRQAKVQPLIGRPDWLWPRDPPVRVRKTVPDSWIELTITEGRNRQVRRMTAAVGLPTLRLVRIGIGPHRLEGLKPGEFREIEH
ncbi:MAG TPA: pseudouridine synthase [Arenimonas sp.]|nr:pseudouridine synthase [Arenimonas sp.]